MLDLEASTTSKLVFDFSSFPQSVSQNNTDIIKGIIDNLVYANNADPSVGISLEIEKLKQSFLKIFLTVNQLFKEQQKNLL